MTSKEGLYKLIEPLPDLHTGSGQGPVLVHGLEGFSDAGFAVQSATRHLRDSMDAQLVAEFDADELIDYRSRRPSLTYSFDHFTGYRDPKVQLHAITDPFGNSFLLLSGMEPDLKWDAFTRSIVELSEIFGVRMSVGLGAMPLGVPHTRPTQSSAHSSDVELIRGFTAWPGEFSIPGSAGSLLEWRMAESGYPSVGFTVHVPQYLAQSTYPSAALSLIGDVAKITGLNLPAAELETAAAEFAEQITEQISDNSEISAAISAMEKQFDEFMEHQRGSNSLNPGGNPLPSGEEIGAEFERFLAEQTGEGTPDHGGEPPR